MSRTVLTPVPELQPHGSDAVTTSPVPFDDEAQPVGAAVPAEVLLSSPILPPPAFRRSKQRHATASHAAAQAHVVHVAGRLGERASRFLQSATETLALAGVKQTLVLVDDPAPPDWIALAAPHLTLVPSPAMGARLRTWWKAMRTVQRTIAEHPGATVHLHGFLPSVFGARALHCAAFKSQVLYSLHGERAVAPWTNLAALPQWMLSRTTRRPQIRMMTSAHAEDHPPQWIGAQAHEFVEVPVPAAYFETIHEQSAQPLIAMSPRAGHSGCAENCAQLAVLMGGSDLRLRFEWLGAASGEDAAFLKAASIATYPKLREQERARRLGGAWLFVSLDTQAGYADDIAQAMAVGLPCVALDSRNNRDLIEHGLTGYLCRDRAELMSRIAELLDDAALRQRMGRAAVERARRRFSDQRFERKLLRAYGLDLVPA